MSAKAAAASSAAAATARNAPHPSASEVEPGKPADSGHSPAPDGDANGPAVEKPTAWKSTTSDRSSKAAPITSTTCASCAPNTSRSHASSTDAPTAGTPRPRAKSARGPLRWTLRPLARTAPRGRSATGVDRLSLCIDESAMQVGGEVGRRRDPAPRSQTSLVRIGPVPDLVPGTTQPSRHRLR
jgi:hypothetical protein